MITIIDYGLGNIGSVKNIIKNIGYKSIITSNPKEVEQASSIILPGVGSFDSGMEALESLDLVGILNEKAYSEKVPFLGICLGAQLMTKRSREGQKDGLGWFDATTEEFNFQNQEGRWPLPNIGWRDVKPLSDESLLKGIEDPRFYFVHSYKLVPNENQDCSIMSSYGEHFCCGLNKDNLHCVQFHPEKSHIYGKKLLKNFLEIGNI
tara:strand:+ start:12338 stop:12958 length:621 start_codon:yes stop_codon:yes gene_type:complete